MQEEEAERAVIAWLDDVLYPSRMYRDGACRAGADLLRRMLGCDLRDALAAHYIPGAEEAAVRAALANWVERVDARLVRKTVAAMVAHAPRVAPYEDASETFGILQALGVPLGLIGEGPPLGQRLVAERLGAERLFRHVLFADPSLGEHGWQDALLLMEMLIEGTAQRAALVCASPARALTAAEKGWQVFFVRRTDIGYAPVEGSPNIMAMTNLYELPEALGLVAWSCN